ncbi:carboxymuconolactone decarboxylase family protein [Aquimarina sp. RZ0]|uniref:carboxymuconolactone decarboxylase family protein n=1 Tax=Aquimarina sp. RZ0 TaxID=2607730 RepID=UPI0011F0E802|nr:carboxymuconolactone decarboxylase family protein [Aquimarina sp. RZ0]KAA1247712.1 carboxymuconolactone decarboxylase family protein [Aquimarina sp. RZ0]
MNLELKPIEKADTISTKILENTQKKLGFIPNMYSGMANNTALLEGYVSSYTSFRANSGFNPQEQEVIFLSIAFDNGCAYCMAAHSFVGDTMTQVPIEVTNAIRNNSEIPDKKLRALSLFSKTVTSKRGVLTQTDIDNFINAGYTQNHILGVIAAVGIKTMSNYFNHIFNTSVDDVFKNRIWKKE